MSAKTSGILLVAGILAIVGSIFIFSVGVLFLALSLVDAGIWYELTRHHADGIILLAGVLAIIGWIYVYSVGDLILIFSVIAVAYGLS